MSGQFGSTRIGAMQYNGATIAEAMIDGVVVWRRIITVTPVAPTFHDGEPWITLPTVEGVTYTVQGTPGYGQTITVTATAQDGYQLDGQTVWTHEWPLPRYVASNSGGAISRLTRDTWRTINSHTVTHDGIASGQWQVEWRGGYFLSDTDVQVLRNGVAIATNSRTAEAGWQSVTITETTLTAGDTLAFRAQWRGSWTASGGYVDAWSWSLT